MNLVSLVILLFYFKGSFGKSKIIGGKAVEEFKYPFVVCIKYWNIFKARDFLCRCGGTLIKEDTVVTAAHCFFYHKDHSLLWASSLRAYAGTVDLHHDQEYHTGEDLIPHPNFKQASLHYDCGVMKLRSEFKLYLGNIGYEIEIYQFDFTSLRKITNDMIIHGEKCWSIGWGAQGNINNEPENFSLVLNEFESNLINYNRCEYESYKKRLRESISLQKLGFLCATDTTRMKKSTCSGDSGSPIICDCVVLGVLSSGPSYACGQDNTPSFYTRIDYVENFLKPFFPGRLNTPSGWRKLRNIVQWTPFFQTYKKQRYPWVQLAGHQGNFKAGPEPGTILKKLCPKEQLCFQILMKDILRPYVPEYKGHVTCDDGDGSSMYLQLQDLLGEFTNPCVMDCKIGVRTYLEEELAKAKEKPKLRKDMYEKMIQIDSNAPTEEEHRLKGVTKPRYMVWRETISSTATLGFRIEGIKKSDGKSSKDFKTTRTQLQIKEAFKDFCDGFPHAIPKYIQRLKAIKATLEVSQFFRTHEMIGSSLLFVHDQKSASVWLIDFAKTLELPKKIMIDHASSWVVGNHEDGYLIGINNLINIFSDMATESLTATTLVVTAPTETEPEISSSQET